MSSLLVDLSWAFAEGAMRTLGKYHRYQAFGFEHIPKTGPALIAFHHSLCTYDSFLLSVPIWDQLGREFRGLADRLIFKTPGLGQFMTDVGFVEGTREATIEMLKQGELIGLAPGGMRESLRSSAEKYTFDWTGRTGFVNVAMRAGAPIILAACPMSDDVYRVLPNPLTPLLYERFKIPVPIAGGRWGTIVPRPVKLWHLLSEPIFSDVAPDQVTDKDVSAQHERVVARMKKLMDESLAMRAELGE
jgi:1-acyl-sn-glycerol-3-phosphate acyltransferase